MMPEVWTTDRVARALDCTSHEVRRLIRAGQIRAKKFGQTYRVEPAAVAEYIDSLEAA